MRATAHHRAGDGSHAGHRFRRPVSPNEWLCLALEQPGSPFVIQLVVEGQGTVTLDALRRAVHRASRACPGARLALRGRMWVDSGRPPAVRQAGDLDTALQAPLDPVAGQGCEVVLSVQPTSPPDTAKPTVTLAFRAHHAVMDGRGLYTWALDVFRVLRGEDPVGAPSPWHDYTLLKSLTGATGTPRRQWQRAAWRSPLSRAAGPEETGARWARRALDGVHPGLVAKIAAAVTDHAGAASRVMVPVDLRRHRPGLRSTANLTLPVFLAGSPGRPWEEWHEQLLRALAADRELAAGEERFVTRLPRGVLRRLSRAAGAAVSALDRYPCTVLVSHLGRVELRDLRAPGFEAHTVYPLPLQAPLIPVSFTTIEFERCTELVVSADSSRHTDRAAALLDAVCEALSPAAHRAGISAAPPTPAEAPATLTALLRRQVRRTPDAPALVGPEGPVSYRELDRRSEGVAAELAARQVGRGAVVGLLADRTPAALAGLWGILKAGAAYLPLDPAHPPARIAGVLADSGAALCLVGARYEALPGEDCPVLVLDGLPTEGAEPAREQATPDDVAYVIYTSGSTGAPKGVRVEHRALVAYVHWATERYGVDATTRFALFTSLAFDLTGTAVFLPLLAGGSIALVPEPADPCSLTDLLTDSGVNALKLTPAHLDLITSLGVEPRGFRALVVGGEQLRGTTAARAQRLFGPGCRIFNEYGPTEATIGCVVHTFDPRRDGDRPAVPIGLPTAGTRVLLMDGDGRPVGPGDVGEIHLAGVQLARGYLGRPGLDRERFVRLADGTRAYRTGDLARLAAHGALEFLGRADDQLSIRGYRIEPAEVEAALEQHPQVTRAVVAARPGPAGEPLLCAYVTGSTDPEALREHTARLLPPHLVPTAIRVVDGFPWTVNGKVDVRALPTPYEHDPAEREPTAPQTDPLVAAVARIWSRHLGAADLPIGPADAFHRLGGDSLTLLLMLNQVAGDLVGQEGREAFRAGLRDLISEVTVERVCAAVRAANTRTRGSCTGRTPGPRSAR